MCFYYWTLDDGRLAYKNIYIYIYILHNVAHQKEHSFGNKENYSNLKLKNDTVELLLSAHYYYYRLWVFVFEPFWTARLSGYFSFPSTSDIFFLSFTFEIKLLHNSSERITEGFN